MVSFALVIESGEGKLGVRKLRRFAEERMSIDVERAGVDWISILSAKAKKAGMLVSPLRRKSLLGRPVCRTGAKE